MINRSFILDPESAEAAVEDFGPGHIYVCSFNKLKFWDSEDDIVRREYQDCFILHSLDGTGAIEAIVFNNFTYSFEKNKTVVDDIVQFIYLVRVWASITDFTLWSVDYAMENADLLEFIERVELADRNFNFS